MEKPKAKRRGNRDGLFRERRPGLWEAQVYLDGHRRSVYGTTRAKASAKLRELLHSDDKGLPVPTSQSTVAEYLTEWLAFVKPRVRPRTYTRYEQIVRVHLIPALGKVRLPRLTDTHLDHMYTAKLESGLSPRTVHHLHVVLGTALRRALKKRLVARNVCQLAEPPAVEASERPTLDAAKVRELLTAAQGDRFEALYWLATHTGAREGELLGLRWRFVDLKAGTVQIVATLQRTPDGFVFGKPKSKKGERTITVGPEVVAALRRHRARQNDERLQARELWGDLDLVFPNEIGRPVEAGNFLRRSFWPLLDKIGLCEHRTTTETRIRRGKPVEVEKVTLIPQRHFHDLRHSFASLAMKRNVHPSIVAATLGHAKTSTTLDMYTHGDAGQTGEATSAVGDLIATAKPARKHPR